MVNRTNPANEWGFLFLQGLDTPKNGRPTSENFLLMFFHKVFTPKYVVSAHPLESSTLARSPAGFFLPVIKPFP